MAGLRRFGCVLALAALAGCGEPEVIFGYMNLSGDWVVPPAYENAKPYSQHLAAAKLDEVWGYVDERGQWAITPRFDSATPFAEGLAAVANDNHWNYIDPTGATVIPGPFADAHPFSSGLAAVRIGDKWGFVDPTGKLAIKDVFDEVADETDDDLHLHATCFSGGLCAVRAGDLWGYIGRDGSWVIPPRYTKAGRFSEGLAAVRAASSSGDKVGYVNGRGDIVIPLRFEDALPFSKGRAVAVVARKPIDMDPNDTDHVERTAVLIDSTGREIAELVLQPVLDYLQGVDVILRGLGLDYMGDGMVPATRGDRWGYMDRNGKWAIEPQFAAALPFRDGHAIASAPSQGGVAPANWSNFGVIDTRGVWTIEPGYDTLLPGPGPFVSAVLHGRFGILDLDGKWVIKPQYAPVDLVPGPPAEKSSAWLIRVGTYAAHEWQVIDATGKRSHARGFEWMQPMPGSSKGEQGASFFDTGPYIRGSRLLPFLQGVSWGLSDAQMHVVVAPQYDELPRQVDDYIEVRRDGRVGCLDLDGRELVPPEFDDLRLCDHGYAEVMREGGWGFWTAGKGWSRATEIDEPSNRVVCAQVAEPCTYTDPDHAWLNRDGQYYLVREGAVVQDALPADELKIRVMHAAGSDRSSRLALVRRGDKWGVYRPDGREWLPCRYAAIGAAFDGLIAAKEGDTWSIVDLARREVIRTQAGEIAPFNRSVAIILEGNLAGLVRRDGRIALTPRYLSIRPVSQTRATFEIPFYGPDGTQDTHDPVRVGMMDDAGTVRVSPDYTSFSRFTGTVWRASAPKARGYALVDDATGKPLPVSRRVTGTIGSLVDGRALAVLERPDGDDAIGYLDASGRVVIEPQYDIGESKDFLGGLAIVGRNGKCGAIDRHGSPLVPIEYFHCKQLLDGRVLVGKELPWTQASATRSTRAH